MKRPKLQASVTVGIVIVALIGLVANYAPVRSQANTPVANPESVFKAQYDAINAGNVEAAMTVIAEDAVNVSLPPPPDSDGIFQGKAAIRKLTEDLVTRHAHFDFLELHSIGETINFRALLVEDVFRDAGFYPIEFSGTAIVQNSLVVAETWMMNQQSLAHLVAAIDRQANKAAARRNYEELWSKGNLAVADEITDPAVVDHHSGQTGTEGLKQFIALMCQAFPDLKVTINNLVAEGDLVVADVTFDEGIYQGGLQDVFGIPDSAIGKSVTIQAIDVYRFKDGKIVEAWGLSDQMNWFKQLGVELAAPAKQ